MRHAGRGQPSGEGAGRRIWASGCLTVSASGSSSPMRGATTSPSCAMLSTGSRVGTERAAGAAERRRADREHVAELRGQMAGASARALRRGASGHRPAGERRRCNTSISRARISISRSATATGNWPGLEVDAPMRRGALSGVQPEIPARPRARCATPADLRRHTLLHANDRARLGANGWTAGVMSRRDTDRGPIFNQASMVIDAAVDGRNSARAHGAGGVGPARRPARAAFRARVASALRVLDRVPEIDCRRCRRSRTFAPGFSPRRQRMADACGEPRKMEGFSCILG